MKRLVLNILDYLRYQVENDRCTMEELRSVADVLTQQLKIDATATDMADFYGQNEANMRNVLSRNFVGKPRRRVYYDFCKVANIIPKSWKTKFVNSIKV
jgi:hypothetical protein